MSTVDGGYGELEENLLTGLQPVVTATQNLATDVIKVSLSVATVMAVLHLLGVLIFHFLKSRSVFVVRTVYIVSSLTGLHMSSSAKQGHFTPDVAASQVPPSGTGRAGGGAGGDSTVDTDEQSLTAASSPYHTSASVSPAKRTPVVNPALAPSPAPLPPPTPAEIPPALLYPRTIQMPCDPSTITGQGQAKGQGHQTQQTSQGQLSASKSLTDVGFSETKV